MLDTFPKIKGGPSSLAYNTLMEAFEAAQKVCKRLQAHGFKAVFAGGCVRDHLLGIMPHDYDIATSAMTDEVMAIFSGSKAVGKAFGVVLVKHSGHEFEVATFRQDGDYVDGRHPESIKFATMEEDASRRDFTVNAMFLDPMTGVIHDFFNGLEDLDDGIIRFVGNAVKRIREDKLRMLRFCRFASQAAFSPSAAGALAVKAFAKDIKDIAPERVREELMKMLDKSDMRKMMKLLFNTGLMAEVLPEVAALKGCEQNPTHHPEGDVWEHTVIVMEQLAEEHALLKLAAMLHDIGKVPCFKIEDGKIKSHGHDKVGAEMADTIMRRLKFSNEEREHVVALVRDHMKVHEVKKMKKSTTKKLLSASHADDLIKLGKADAFGRHFEEGQGWEVLQRLRDEWEPEEIKPEPLLTGKDLIAMGFKPSPLFKKVLEAVQDEQLEGNIASREEAVEFVEARWTSK